MLGQHDQSQQLEELLDHDDRIIALHTADSEATLVAFRLICRRSGRSIYHWSDNQGIVSLKAADISVPGCRKLQDALRYVIQSMHYGVYLFTRFEKQLRPGIVHLLREIAALREPRTIILVGSQIELPQRLSECVRHVLLSDLAEKGSRPRLRDGRWIL